MPRKIRFVYSGALYHIINRGNYRADIFATDGAIEAFELCLWEACGRANWKVHAYVVMRNHYHLALETPDGNLVEGMRWLQATYANRFNRYRKENGHVFQGRYRAIAVENLTRLGAVGHYIHLNPVRANLLPMERLEEFTYGSFPLLTKPSRRPAALSFSAVLEAAGGLKDTESGRRNYRAFLTWLSTDDAAQKEMEFATMARGWAMGSDEFKQGLVQDHSLEQKRLAKGRSAMPKELRELEWTAQLETCLRVLGKSRADAAADRKAAPWKVAIAAHLKTTTTVTNPWMAAQLSMGAPEGVSRYVTEFKAGQRPDASKSYEKCQ